MWGTWFGNHPFGRNALFIPTCVGNIQQSPDSRAILSVHPHVCGEHYRFIPTSKAFYGSSPRVWGTFPCLSVPMPFCRFIPTCVGNIKQNKENRLKLPVHPHVCGEHRINGCSCCCVDGSSPRVWGTFKKYLDEHGKIRFIPTCVGNMRAMRQLMIDSAVHPHVCGEHF